MNKDGGRSIDVDIDGDHIRFTAKRKCCIEVGDELIELEGGETLYLHESYEVLKK